MTRFRLLASTCFAATLVGALIPVPQATAPERPSPAPVLPGPLDPSGPYVPPAEAPVLQASTPVFADGQAQIVPAFQDPRSGFGIGSGSKREFDSDGDGKRDRMHVDVTRPAQTETERPQSAGDLRVVAVFRRHLRRSQVPLEREPGGRRGAAAAHVAAGDRVPGPSVRTSRTRRSTPGCRADLRSCIPKRPAPGCRRDARRSAAIPSSSRRRPSSTG